MGDGYCSIGIITVGWVEHFTDTVAYEVDTCWCVWCDYEASVTLYGWCNSEVGIACEGDIDITRNHCTTVEGIVSDHATHTTTDSTIDTI